MREKKWDNFDKFSFLVEERKWEERKKNGTQKRFLLISGKKMVERMINYNIILGLK